MIVDDTPAKTESKSESKPDTKPADTSSTTSTKSDASAGYSRGENQKAVTQAYRDNWNLIYGKKEKPARTGNAGAKAQPRPAAMSKAKQTQRAKPARKAVRATKRR